MDELPQLPTELIETLSADAADQEKRQAALLELQSEVGICLPSLRKIGLVQRDDLRPFGELFTVSFELFVDAIEVLQRVGVFTGPQGE